MLDSRFDRKKVMYRDGTSVDRSHDDGVIFNFSKTHFKNGLQVDYDERFIAISYANVKAARNGETFLETTDDKVIVKNCAILDKELRMVFHRVAFIIKDGIISITGKEGLCLSVYNNAVYDIATKQLIEEE